RVLARRVVTELDSGELWLQRNRRSGQRRSTQWRAGVAAVPVDATIDIAGKDLRGRQQLMCEHDGRGRLQVRETRRYRVDVLRRLRTQCFLQVEYRGDQRTRLIPQIQLEVVRRLIVARPAGAKLAAQWTETLGQHPLDERVHILILLGWQQRSGSPRRPDRLELGDDRIRFGCGQYAGALQLARMGLRRDDV